MSKQLLVGMCTPTAGLVNVQYVASLPSMVLHFLQTPVLSQEYSTKNIHQQVTAGANIGEARDNMVDACLERGCTHVLFIDDDMGFEPDCLTLALNRQLPVVLANYRRRKPPAPFITQKKDEYGTMHVVETTADKNSCEEVWYGGFGFCLIEREVLEAVKRPRFMMYYMPPPFDLYTTEDLPFFNAVHEAGFPVFLDHKLSKKVWHNGTYEYTWDTDQIHLARARDRTTQ